MAQELNTDSLYQAILEYDYPERGDSLQKYFYRNRKIPLEIREEVFLTEINNLKEQDKNHIDIVRMSLWLHISFYRESRYDETLYLAVEAKNIANEYGQETDEWYDVQSTLHTVMAASYYVENDHAKALEEEKKSYHYSTLMNDTFLMARSLNNIGVNHSELKDSKKAIEFYQKAYDLSVATGDESSALRNKFCIAIDQSVMKENDKAITTFLEIMPRLRETNHFNLAQAIRELGHLYYLKGNYVSAEKLMLEGYDMAFEQKNNNSILQSSNRLTNLYKKTDRYKEALVYSQIRAEYIDTIKTRALNNKKLEAQSEFDNLVQEQQIKELEFQQEIQGSKFKTQLAWIVSSFLVLIGLLSFFFYRTSQKRKQKLALANKEAEVQKVRERLLTSITHELRTPLTLILGQLDELKQKELKPQNKDYAVSASRNAEELLSLINQLLDWNRLEANAMTLSEGVGDIALALNNVFEKVQKGFSSKNLNWELEMVPKNFTCKLDFSKVETIVRNLLTNAVKYTPDHGDIKLSLSVIGNNQLKIAVNDTGKGISSQEQEKIFDWYFRTKQNELQPAQGFGIGLALSKELAELMKGSLSVDSAVGKGSTFQLIVPYSASTLHEQASLLSENKIGEKAKSDIAKGKDKPQLLLIEDHEELAQFISSILSKDYEVSIAHEGKPGLQMAFENIPDIIITDLMLPDADGIELTKKLKNNMMTDHIPVLMLTAKADEATRFKGIESRADAFLTKPFKSEELKLQLNNLVQNRRRLKMRYQIQYNGKNKVEERIDPFIALLMEKIEANFSESDFNVDALAQLLKISRGQLFKKTKALLDTSPSKLIRSHRLEKAKQMLSQGQYNVSEVAYASGFSSPEYFSTVYKDYFKISPAEERKSS